jgi:hypothetical protein
MSSVIDYLFEDPEIPSQRYSLISIVGPHMPQKCDVWGLKIRGCAETMDEAKAKISRLMKIDNAYDIYIVETGKFFPLGVEPTSIGNVEYQNETLNNLIKEYLANKARADDDFHSRKAQLTEAAIKEGLNPDRRESPVVVYTTIKTLESTVSELERNLKESLFKLEESRREFTNKFDETERESAQKEFEEKIGAVKV